MLTPVQRAIVASEELIQIHLAAFHVMNFYNFKCTYTLNVSLKHQKKSESFIIELMLCQTVCMNYHPSTKIMIFTKQDSQTNKAKNDVTINTVELVKRINILKPTGYIMNETD